MPTPSLLELLERSGVRDGIGAGTKTALRDALRSAATARVDGVLSHQRRRQYEHAARLVACSVEVDAALGNTVDGASWAKALQQRSRRYPAFQAELRRALALAGVRA